MLGEGREPVVPVAAQDIDGAHRVVGKPRVHGGDEFLELSLDAKVLGLVDQAAATAWGLEVDEADGATAPVRIAAARADVADPAVAGDREGVGQVPPM